MRDVLRHGPIATIDAVASPEPRSDAPTRQSSRPRTIRGLDAEQRRQQRRRQLLAATLDLVASQGYANTSIEQICQTAYVGNKAFYELFTTKEDCYLELLTEVSDQLLDTAAAALAQPADDAREAEAHALCAFAHALVDDPRIARVTFGEASGISPAVERQRRTNRRQAAHLIEGFWLQQAVETHPRAIYRSLSIAAVGGLFDIVADWLYDSDQPQPPGIETLIDDLVTFVGIIRAGLAAS